MQSTDLVFWGTPRPTASCLLPVSAVPPNRPCKPETHVIWCGQPNSELSAVRKFRKFQSVNLATIVQRVNSNLFLFGFSTPNSGYKETPGV
ncbi:hypothetical protein CPB83DRAFT_359527 [Crepidotus variabilis]|uniref:Uncharacterized protein n=1 Tax=Crepidotus variabilis TaxID=179855 RepID=A0A9P6JPT7_9AGAR|nr:hypothetical protein CPB83DRAFT_359527 [Crepidotus variabilis]